MSAAKLRRQLSIPPRAWSAREILLALIEQGDLVGDNGDGTTRIVFDVTDDVLDALMVFDDCGRDDEQLDERSAWMRGGQGA